MSGKLLAVLVPIVLLSAISGSFDAQTAYVDNGGYRPHYQGFGTDTPAGRGGSVYKVTNLNGYGPGSLRAGVEALGARFVVFETSGTIFLDSPLHIANPYITIAGQTAPSPGITIAARCGMRIETHNVVLQHVRIRRGDSFGLCGGQDVLWLRNGVHHVVLDHLSLSWGVDENIGVTAATGPGAYGVAILDCIVSEGLYVSAHLTGYHSKGLLVNDNFQGAGTIAIARNLFAHSDDRNPQVKSGWQAIITNNLTYNAGTRSGGFASFSGGQNPNQYFSDHAQQIVYEGNVAIPGPNTTAGVESVYIRSAHPTSEFYLFDNIGEGITGRAGDAQWAGVYFFDGFDNEDDIRVDRRPTWYSEVGFQALPSEKVESYVLSNAGARPFDRDSVDARIVSDVKSRTGSLIDSELEVGGFPILAINTHTLRVPNYPNVIAPGQAVRTNMEVWLENHARELEGRAPIPALVPTPPPPPPSAGLVAHWKLDTGSGSVAPDSSGTNHGTINGASWTTGRLGTALSFDGRSDYVNAGNDGSLDAASEITVSLWLSVDAFLQLGDDEHRWNTALAKGNCTYQIRKNGHNANNLRVTFRDGNCEDLHLETELVTNDITGGGWHHIVATFSEAAGKAVVYQDGRRVSEASIEGNIGITTDALTIGAHTDGEKRHWPGRIDDVRIYNRALTAAEVSGLHYVE